MNLVRNKLMSGVNAYMPASRSMARKRLANATFDSLISRAIGCIDDHTVHRLNLDGSVAASGLGAQQAQGGGARARNG